MEDGRRFRGVFDRNRPQNIFGIRLCIFNGHVEEATTVENSGIVEFELGLLT
jgi:hypothetical protein